jgi:hypothetical protein
MKNATIGKLEAALTGSFVLVRVLPTGVHSWLEISHNKIKKDL